MTRKQKSPTLAMRLNEDDKNALRDLATRLNRSQTDTVRVLVREARCILPELKTRAVEYPKPRPGRQTLAA